jgi:hypothetical protein
MDLSDFAGSGIQGNTEVLTLRTDSCTTPDAARSPGLSADPVYVQTLVESICWLLRYRALASAAAHRVDQRNNAVRPNT